MHYMCALWSSTVELMSDDTITGVDQAAVTGGSQRCDQCTNFGATMSCKVSFPIILEAKEAYNSQVLCPTTPRYCCGVNAVRDPINIADILVGCIKCKK